MAIYKDNEIEEYTLYGLDMIGKLIKDVPNYYFKDHLGSVRAIVNPDNELVSAQDYDQWGYLLEGRTFESDVSKFKFTSKERDQESFYDYFGARYYDAKVGRWCQIEPLWDKYPNLTPYSYSVDNPLRVIDPNGADPFEIIIRTYIPTEYAFNFKGDNRGPEAYPQSYRSEQIISIETNPNVSSDPLLNKEEHVGLTIGYFPNIEGSVSIETGRAKGNFSAYVMRGEENNGDNSLITLSGSLSNPLVPGAPPIQYNISIQIIPSSNGTTVKILGGSKTKYPSTEVYIENSKGERQLIENYPAAEGFTGPFQLFNKMYIEPYEKNIK